MNRKLLLAMQKRNKKRLEELRSKLKNNEVREEDLEAVQSEVDELSEEAQEIADALENLPEEDPDNNDKDSTDPENGDAEDDPEEDQDENKREKGITPEQRDGILTAIGKGLSTRGHKSTKNKEKEIRQAFANFVVGRISESEARSLGIEAGNGGVVIPDVVASEIITYAEEENLLRKYGTTVRTKGNVKYPVLVKKATANVNKKERAKNNPIPETDIEFDEIYLDPAEFDALATVTKKLINMTGVNVEDVVIEELKKAYVRKEINYMFNGDDVGNENPGALAKKAVAFTPSIVVNLTAADAGQKLYDALIELKNTPVTEIMKKGRFIINRAALTAIEKMKTADGFPLLRPFTQAEGGIGHTLVGYPVDWTDAADGADPDVPVLYFGDFKAFKIQDVIGALQLQKLLEKYADTNRIGFQIYNLLDGKLVYSPFEPAVYRYEIGAAGPVGP
ncbi:phage major capsid protein [Sporosarcina cyprini]|uniref:phage major capsid protein n=1 Tax=Sporosarcina cyprini TaxID=2910523 RepID=UPI001EDD4984|nr:phage major capsid protein [Sporosarcina cyprini]MCG3089137.1 phage major capsid protein [Sporosarcina cyprini]